MALRFVITTDASGAITGVKQLGEAADDAGKKLDQMGEKGKASGDEMSGGLDKVSSKAAQTGKDFGAFLAGGAGVAGLAIGAIVTGILADLSKTQALLAETRAAGGDLAKELYDNHGELPLQSKVDKLFDTLSKEVRANGPVQQLIDQYVDFGVALDGIATTAKKLDRPLDDLKNALSGDDLDESKRILKEVNAELDAMKSNVFTGWVWETGPLDDYQKSLEGVIEQHRIAESLQTPEIMNAQRVDDLAAAWENATSKFTDYLTPGENADFKFDVTAYLADMENQILRADELKADLVRLPPEIAAEAEAIWAEHGVIAADSYVDSFEAASPDIQARMTSVAVEAGTSAGQGWVDAATAKVEGWSPRHQKVVIDVDDSAVRRWEAPPKYGTVQYAVSGRPYTGQLDG
jgi:hypothetical protein